MDRVEETKNTTAKYMAFERTKRARSIQGMARKEAEEKAETHSCRDGSGLTELWVPGTTCVSLSFCVAPFKQSSSGVSVSIFEEGSTILSYVCHLP